MQILDEGRITDAQGRRVSFENTVIVMTSNAGSNIKGGSVGFDKAPNEISRDRAMKALSDFLRPEFMARIDEIVVFKNLRVEDFRRIAALMLDEIKGPLKRRGIAFGYDDSALELIAQRAFGQKAGARDIRRVIRREVEDPLTRLIVDSGVDVPTLISVSVKDEKLALVTA
ncbi:Chaperone protein ClpB [bioreactor metagenome]|uniref:Chaperone protein ClpB n=1 Tax=bioreactor metagenome TaxID=1076179 RepID=A0A645J221_9ZZZZ